MRGINRKQKQYYESQFVKPGAQQRHKRLPAANRLTNVWALLRRGMLRSGNRIGVNDLVFSLHRRWMGDLGDATVLDLGCFDGNQLSLWIAARCREYIGLDLSENAIAVLNEKLAAEKLQNARAIAADLLDGVLPADSIDLVYAQGVVHHFQDLDEALRELARVMKPGGTIVTVDPMMTEPFNRFFRVLYRPFQTNAAWEWPFTRRTFRTIERYFEIEEMQGFFGLARFGLPLLAVPGLRWAGRRLSQWGLEFDRRHARQFGFWFYFCWKVTMKLRLRPDGRP